MTPFVATFRNLESLRTRYRGPLNVRFIGCQNREADLSRGYGEARFDGGTISGNSTGSKRIAISAVDIFTAVSFSDMGYDPDSVTVHSGPVWQVRADFANVLPFNRRSANRYKTYAKQGQTSAVKLRAQATKALAMDPAPAPRHRATRTTGGNTLGAS